MNMVIGQQAPNFSLKDQQGKKHTLKDYIGKWILLYFYPKDSTPGCTAEACAVRDAFADFKKNQAIVLGVSADSEKSHKEFADTHELPFPLLADTEKIVSKMFGVYGKKKMMGRSFFGIKRSSFLINPKGKIVKIYEQVKPKDHAQEVLNDIIELKQ